MAELGVEIFTMLGDSKFTAVPVNGNVMGLETLPKHRNELKFPFCERTKFVCCTFVNAV